MKNLKLKSPKHSKPEEEKRKQVVVVAVPPQTPEMDQSFTYTMKLKK